MVDRPRPNIERGESRESHGGQVQAAKGPVPEASGMAGAGSTAGKHQPV